MDDTLLYTNSIEKSFHSTWDFLTLLADKGIVANAEKFQFCQDIVDFAGLTVTSYGVALSSNMLAAIQNFPTPNDITGARSWFGLVNQVSCASISPIMQPFRDLIKPNVKFYWDSTLDELFQKSKQGIIQSVKEGVQSFEPQRRTCLQTNWCQEGIGYLLLQQHCTCISTNIPTCCPTGWKLVYAGSRFTNASESRYSPTEGEALAVTWSLQHSRMFTLGCTKLVVSVDHKPLLGIFNNRELSSIKNLWLLNLKESTFAWTFNMTYNPGKWHRGPDAISRNPTHQKNDQLQEIFQIICSDTDSIETENTDTQFQSATISHLEDLSHSVLTYNQIRSATTEDQSYTKLKTIITQGFPDN